MLDPREVITSLFVMLNHKLYILVRIEFLVIAITGLFLAMMIMDFRRNRSHGSLRNSVLKVLDGVSDSMVVYTLGAMQAASFNNQLFPVWAMVVVSFRSSINYISGYGPRGLETGNLMRPLYLAFLNSRRGSKLKVQLWTLWVVMLLRSANRSLARFKADKSVWNGNYVDLLAEYMRSDHSNSTLKPDDCNPSTMEGYTHLVSGESMQRLRMLKPRYIVFLQITRPRLLVTLDKIWRCNGRLLLSNDSRGEHLKDLSLAFVLSRLLRCRLQDAALHSDCLLVTRNLVRSKILMKNADRAFRILEQELTFLNDSLHTSYPSVFWAGLYSLFLSLSVSLVTFGVACWLAVDIRKIYRPPEGDLVIIVNGANVDIIITWLLMLFMMVREVWEMVTYLLSDWTRLLLVCEYVRWRCLKNSLMEKLIWSFFTSKISGRWHGLVDQYEFLRSFDYVPSTWNSMNRVTLGMVPLKKDGAQLGAAIKVPECVKPAIMRALRSMNLGDGSGCLPRQIPSLSADGLMDKFGWACELPRCSQVILVWHIASSLCEINLALDRGIDLKKPGFLSSALSYMTSFCCSSQPYLVDYKILDADLKINYQIANSLSRYCAYLLISQPELLPDSFLLPDLLFQATVGDAREILKDHDSLYSRYTMLTKLALEAILDNKTFKWTGNIVEKGAELGWNLIQLNNEELCWKILAGVWVDLIVHIAPTWNIAAHTKRLQSGGEFVTHIWALLCHFGIEKSSLWQSELAAPGPQATYGDVPPVAFAPSNAH